MGRKCTIREELEPMAVGETKEFPAERNDYVRYLASVLGFKWDKVFTTAMNRERRVLEVTRTK